MDPSSPLHRATACSTVYGRQTDTLQVVSFASGRMLAPPNFNFGDLPMKKAPSDYFNAKPMRGSSPTASLAADLSQNFHIDKSPDLPTPRRSLFSTRNNIFSGYNSDGHMLTTPPILSSSPGMDISPLPHKAPFSIAVHLQSPTPELTPSADSSSLLDSPAPSESLPEPPTLTFPQEKKRFGPLRPAFTRPKGHSLSANSIPQRRSVEGQLPLPPFRFGDGGSKALVASSLSLSEAFADSPPSEKSQLSGSLVTAVPRSQAFPNAFPSIRGGCGSPISNHSRKTSHPYGRPKKMQRRTHSMYEHPGDVVQQEHVAPPLAAIIDAEPYTLQLPHFDSDQVGDLPRITGSTMIDVLDGKYSHLHEKVLVIDCRFEYEYDGGHINGALNFNDKERLAEHLFDTSSPSSTSRALIIFHCEYSAHRAPIMAKFLRSHDRSVNAERYPALTYPEAYILDGGYSSFFKNYRSRCFPQEYVEMDSQEHVQACERGMGKVKKQRPTQKMVRAATFAMGQGSSPMGSSPMGARGAQLQRHASESMWSPKAIGRGSLRNTSESSIDALMLSPGDTSMCLSDADSDMDLSTDLPKFNRPTVGRPSIFGTVGGAQCRRSNSMFG